jgi:cell wall-associated NlpC family hydrolase
MRRRIPAAVAHAWGSKDPFMHRAKHRAAGRAGGEVLATALLERYAVVPGPRPERVGPRHAGATPPDVAPPDGPDLFGRPPYTAPMLVVPSAAPPAEAPADRPAPLFDGAAAPVGPDGSPFGASRHARTRAVAVPGPRVPAPPVGGPTLSGLRVRPQPVGAALSVTVLGAAAAVTAVVVPAPTMLETTGSLAPVESTAPAPAVPLGAVPAAPAALPEQPTMRIKDLVNGVAAQMQAAQLQRVTPATRSYTTVANTTALSSPAAMRKAAMTTALAKLGKPYRWGAMGPNAFDCSGLVKWSFAQSGRSLPRTSRAMASVGTPVRKADLQPGDLVFFYQPISHVGIYIGNGKIVHASRSGQPVKISDMSRMRFTTARRV